MAGTPDQDDWMAYRKRHGLGKWNVRAALYGSAEVVDAALVTLKRAWSKIPDARVRVDGMFAPDEYDQLTTMSQRVCAGVPALDMLERWTPEIGHLDISPVLPMEGRRVAEVMTAVRNFITTRFGGLEDNGALYQMGERSCVIIFGLGFLVSDEPAVRNAFDVGRELVDMLAGMGYSEYRAHVHLMDHVAEKFSFGDHAYRRFCEAIKDAVDPNGILSPGRYGIWPKHMRS
jgi:4-cresol dehydrogenase (hydroxylating)